MTLRNILEEDFPYLLYDIDFVTILHISDTHVVSKLSDVDPEFWKTKMLKIWNFEILKFHNFKQNVSIYDSLDTTCVSKIYKIVTKTISYKRYGEILFQKVA